MAFEYVSQNTGVLLDNAGTQVDSGVESTSQAFTVGNSGSATNGQARITKITVTVK